MSIIVIVQWLPFEDGEECVAGRAVEGLQVLWEKKQILCYSTDMPLCQMSRLKRGLVKTEQT